MTAVASEQPTTSTRDLRVDFFRGLALWVIFWDHCLIMARIEFALYYMTPAFLMFSDAAELFVFLSGYVFGIVYMKTLLTAGFQACYVKALRRVWELYRSNALTFLVCMSIVCYYFTYYDFTALEADSFVKNPAALLPLGLILHYLPFGFGILPLYIVLLAFMPLLLWLYWRSPKTAIGTSIALYLLAQCFPQFNLPRYRPSLGSDGYWFFNTLAWQLLFFIGMALGVQRRLGKSPQVLRRRLWVWAAVLFIALSPIMKVGGVLFHVELAPLVEALQSGDIYERIEELTGITDEDIYAGKGAELGFPLTEKRLLEPLRLLHFFSAVYLVVVLLPAGIPFWRSRWVAPLALCGRHSLEVFCFSIVLNYVVGMQFQVHGGGALAFLGYAVVGFALITGLAFVLEYTPPKSRGVTSQAGTQA